MARMQWWLAALWPIPVVVAAQEPQQQQPSRQQQQASPAEQQPNAWAQLPRMQLDRQFAGPLQDTIVQRWHDPIDDTVCYIYLPITAEHSAPGPQGFVQYGANVIGSISCIPSPAPAPARRPERRPR
jgi:hypothetical protein